MRAKSLALLVLALGCGLVASIGITQVMARRDTGGSGATGDTQLVFVATKTIPPGEPLSLDAVELVPWPEDRVPPGAIGDFKDIDGRKCRTKLYKGEPILESKLGDGGNASELIPAGYRVVSVKVDSVSSGSGLIRPGDRVDLLVHMVRNPSKGIHQTSTRTFLQDVKIFAVNDVFNLGSVEDNDDSMIAKTVSLLVTPEQAQEVMFAGELGKIQLVMRNSSDDDHDTIAEIAVENLLPKVEGPAGAEDNKGLQDFLDSMEKPEPSDGTSAGSPTYTMRIIDGTEVRDVQLRANPGGGRSGAGGWIRGDETTNDQTSVVEPDETAADDTENEED